MMIKTSEPKVADMFYDLGGARNELVVLCTDVHVKFGYQWIAYVSTFVQGTTQLAIRMAELIVNKTAIALQI